MATPTSCTRPAALTSITKFDCALHFGQIVALLFQRAQTTPSFATQAELQTLAKWTPLLTATDGTKVIISTEFGGFTLPGSEPQYTGENSNDSIDGLGEFTGFNSVKATGKFYGIPSAIKADLIKLVAESAPGLNPGLTVFPITGDGRIIYDLDANGDIRGIPCVNFYVSSLASAGFNAKNENTFGLTFTGQWDDNVQITKPNFNARTALR